MVGTLEESDDEEEHHPEGYSVSMDRTESIRIEVDITSRKLTEVDPREESGDEISYGKVDEYSYLFSLIDRELREFPYIL